jgi:nicotinamidase-related amidase
MSTLTNRNRRVLLVVDVQNGVVLDAWNRDEIVSRMAAIVVAARAHGLPIVWVQHNEPEMPIDSEYWHLVPELKIGLNEPLVHKQFRSSFEDTDLEDKLAELQANHLIVIGAQTNNCIRSTVYSALEKGYDVTLIADAHTTSDDEWNGNLISAENAIVEQNRTFENYELPGRSCEVKTMSEFLDDIESSTS